MRLAIICQGHCKYNSAACWRRPHAAAHQPVCKLSILSPYIPNMNYNQQNHLMNKDSRMTRKHPAIVLLALFRLALATTQLKARPIYHASASPAATIPANTLADSPAIDVAPCSSTITMDQRTIPRPQSSLCDPGAYEFDGTSGNSVYLSIILSNTQNKRSSL